MRNRNENKSYMLIAESSDINRMILANIFEDDYEILEAEDGEKASALINQHYKDMDIILLDCALSKVDCFEILTELKRSLRDIPVIMVSAENNLNPVTKAYRLGAFDYITRPFNSAIVKRRVDNIMTLRHKEKQYVDVLTTQMTETYRNSHMITQILSDVIEFRSGENSLHTIHVELLSDMFLRELLNISDKYFISADDVLMIPMAAAMHDIGKISISSEVLNKPGKLTDEEFELVKKHTTYGSEILNSVEVYREDPLIKMASAVCHWHHERYDGHGYPDGLVGDEIPISAQIVSIADAYDSLTSDRSYRKAFSYEEATKMILDGKSGVFNPLLLDCLRNMADEIPDRLSKASTQFYYEEDIHRIIGSTLHQSR